MTDVDILIEQSPTGEYYGTTKFDCNLIVESDESEEKMIHKVKQSLSEITRIGINKFNFILKYDRKLLKKRLETENKLYKEN